MSQGRDWASLIKLKTEPEAAGQVLTPIHGVVPAGSSHRGSESITHSSAASPAPARDPPRGTLLLYFLRPWELLTGTLMSLTFSRPSSSSCFSCVQSCAELLVCSGAALACYSHPELLLTLREVKWALLLDSYVGNGLW